MSQIICQNLAVGYGRVAVLEGLNFSLPANSYTCIVGENGSGKTTLMRTLLGLLSPLAGEIKFDNLNASDLAYMPQQSLVQRDFPASVREVVLSGCLKHLGWKPFYGKAEQDAATAAMKKLQIIHLAKHSYRELSGGQQQRVLLARALCAANKVLFLDEPTAGLDPGMTEELYQIIQALHEDGIGIVMISHDLQGTLAYAKEVLEVGQSVSLISRDDYVKKFIQRNKEQVDSLSKE